MSDIVKTFRSYALDKDNFPRMATEVVPTRVSMLLEAADKIERLEAALREIAKVTYGWEPGVWSEEETRKYFASLFFNAQAKARAALENTNEKV